MASYRYYPRGGLYGSERDARFKRQNLADDMMGVKEGANYPSGSVNCLVELGSNREL